MAVVVLLHIVYFLCKKLPPDSFESVSVVMGLVFSVLIVVNVVTAVSTMIEKERIRAQQAGLSSKAELSGDAVGPGEAGTYPNIYYLLSV